MSKVVREIMYRGWCLSILDNGEAYLEGPTRDRILLDFEVDVDPIDYLLEEWYSIRTRDDL